MSTWILTGGEALGSVNEAGTWLPHREAFDALRRGVGARVITLATRPDAAFLTTRDGAGRVVHHGGLAAVGVRTASVPSAGVHAPLVALLRAHGLRPTQELGVWSMCDDGFAGCLSVTRNRAGGGSAACTTAALPRRVRTRGH